MTSVASFKDTIVFLRGILSPATAAIKDDHDFNEKRDHIASKWFE